MKNKLIVIVAIPDMLILDVAGPLDAFRLAKSLIKEQYNQIEHFNYDIVIASPTDELCLGDFNGLKFSCNKRAVDITEPIDTLIISGFSFKTPMQEYLIFNEWLKQNACRIRRICSVCIGAFLLAESGLLDGKLATTHWMYCDLLKNKYPLLEVDSKPIYIKQDFIYTSAGASAGIDLCLALIEEDFGKEISLSIAKILVMYLQRHGNQSQYSNFLSQPVAVNVTIKKIHIWIIENLHKSITVLNLAENAAMSLRNFNRVFTAETGITPAKYVEKIRLETAKKYLEETDHELKNIARLTGFVSIDTMRAVFMKHYHISPSVYRVQFRKSTFNLLS
jgi:transcriptional regulator GlxA family with amidase domain